MRLSGLIVKYIFILSLPVLFLSASFAWGFNSLWIYERGFQKYNVSQTSGLSTAELKIVGKQMISYFNSNEEYVHITVDRNSNETDLFTTEEKIHLKDVKHLLRLDYGILIATSIIVLIYVSISIFWRKNKNIRSLAKNIIWGCLLTIILMIITGLAVFASFDKLFLQFHYLVFTNPYWSAEGYMLILFGDLWYDSVLIGTGFMAGLALLFSIPAIIYLKINRPEKYNVKI